MTYLVTFAPDPKSRPHHEAAPATTLHILDGLIAEMRREGLPHITADELERAVSYYRKVRP